MESLADVFREVIPLLQGQMQQPHHDDSPVQRAIRSVWTAVDTTKMRMKHVADGREERRSDAELVDIWSDAALKIGPFNPPLAERLRAKSEYWSDPPSWAPGDLDENTIKIEAIAIEARKLIRLLAASPDQPESNQGLSHDFFISHAGRDKDSVARPLAEGLTSKGFRVWFDESTLQMGDDLRAELDGGLSGSRFGVLILSFHFFERTWTMNELAAFLALEGVDGRKRVLPVRHGISHGELAKKSPTLAGRVSASTDEGMDSVINKIAQAVK